MIHFYNEETACIFELGSYDYIVDAMDTVDSKLLLIQRARECNTSGGLMHVDWE